MRGLISVELKFEQAQVVPLKLGATFKRQSSIVARSNKRKAFRITRADNIFDSNSATVLMVSEYPSKATRRRFLKPQGNGYRKPEIEAAKVPRTTQPRQKKNRIDGHLN